MNNQDNENVFQKSQINWLACIYGGHHLKPYKMGVLRIEILQVLIKKEEKYEKIG